MLRRKEVEEAFPEMIEIGDSRWHIVFAERLVNGDLGFADGEMRLIGLSLDQSWTELQATFFHEVLHAVEFETGMELGHPRIKKLEHILAAVVGEMYRVRMARDSATR